MDAQQFAYWLQGFAELSGEEPPTPAQWKSIREHLGLAFRKVTPPVDLGPLRDWKPNVHPLPCPSPASPTCIAGRPEPVRAECLTIVSGDGW